MTYPTAAGYGQLPNGLTVPEIFSPKVIKAFRQTSVADEITNNEFEGEITAKGGSVRILKASKISVNDYARGQEITSPQDILDEDLSLVIDQGKYYHFQIQDIETKQSHIDLASLYANDAGFELKNAYDTNILSYMLSQGTAATGLGVSGTPITIGYGSGEVTPLNAINRMARLLDDNNVPDDGGRFFLAAPSFYEALGQEDSKAIDVMVTGDAQSLIRNRKLGARPYHGMTMFKSNNTPLTAGSNLSIIAGHKGAVATAKQLINVESFRSQKHFGTEFRGLLVFGRKAIRTEALFTGAYALGSL